MYVDFYMTLKMLYYDNGTNIVINILEILKV